MSQPARRVPTPAEYELALGRPLTDDELHALAAASAAEAVRDYEPVQPHGTDWRALLKRIWAPIAAAAGFLAKFGAVLVKLKFLTVAASMLVSIGVYVWIGGWWFGIGLVALILVHELGHALELRRQGVPAGLPVFIPFLGAFIAMRRLPLDAWNEARVALAGPLVGSLGALAVYLAGRSLDSRPLVALAYIGFFINLFNLLPVPPLDGGRAVSALHPALWLVGLGLLVALAVRWHNPFLYLIILLAGGELLGRWRGRRAGASSSYYRVRPWQRAAVAIAYFGLAALLVLGMDATNVPRSF